MRQTVVALEENECLPRKILTCPLARPEFFNILTVLYPPILQDMDT